MFKSRNEQTKKELTLSDVVLKYIHYKQGLIKEQKGGGVFIVHSNWQMRTLTVIRFIYIVSKVYTKKLYRHYRYIKTSQIDQNGIKIHKKAEKRNKGNDRDNKNKADLTPNILIITFNTKGLNKPI